MTIATVLPKPLASLLHAIVDALLGEDSTVALERFIAATSLGTGLWWILVPEFAPFRTLGDLMEWKIAGALLFSQGVLHLMVLGRPPDINWCRRSALMASALWGAVTLMFIISLPLYPPKVIFVVPITSAIATAAMLIYLRLSLLYYEPKR